MTPSLRGMATATMVGAVGTAWVLYYSGWGNPWSGLPQDPNGRGETESLLHGGHRRLSVSTSRPPSTWFEALATISETLRFTYSETLGKWPIGDLAFGINYLLRRQGQLNVASVFGADDAQQLQGPDVLADMKELLRLLTICIHFSKKTFPQFLEITEFTRDQVLLEEGRAGLLKPAFTVLVDHHSQSVLLLIRGTHSMKDTLTAVTGSMVPFHHTVMGDSGISNLVLGYAHCGMVAAARWIAQLSTSILTRALNDYPTYQIKVVGHSLGGGTAALLTYILRERLRSTKCVCFAPAACMTWELAESGSSFVTTVINGSDLVPSFCAASLDDLRAEVTASAWVNDFREQIERTRILRTVYHSVTALGSRLQSLANLSRATLPYSTLMVSRAAQTGVAGAGMIWRPVSNGTQVVMKQAQNVAQAVVRRPSFAAWSCMGPRRRNVVSSNVSNTDVEETSASAVASDKEKIDSCEVIEDERSTSAVDEIPTDAGEGQQSAGEYWESYRQSLNDGNNADKGLLPDSREDELDRSQYNEFGLVDDADGRSDHIASASGVGDIGEDLLWQQLAQELQRQQVEGQVQGATASEEEAAAAREITEEEEHVVSTTASALSQDRIVSEKEPEQEYRRLYPPGRLMHLVSPLLSRGDSETEEQDQQSSVGLFLTDRALYGKVRLSRTMVHDHYMPNYKVIMTKLIEQLEKEVNISS